ncbi:AbrB family transcriptional regulator [Mycobacteroides franklinii]|nr:AbrB family transcriptional regulator [Mycobacteroides franklinii]TDZ45220.1 putative ammonia monooxygenase [Mycobacteroides franklinii]TDZ72329.1 putative ammonia monooxygenase [Mycobacteroides franklinii]
MREDIYRIFHPARQCLRLFSGDSQPHACSIQPMDTRPGPESVNQWLLLAAITAALTSVFSIANVPAAPLVAGTLSAAALALLSRGPKVLASSIVQVTQSILGVHLVTLVHRDQLMTVFPQLPWIVTGAIATLAISAAGGFALHRVHHAHVGRPTAILASIAGGSTSLTTLAKDAGGDASIVASLQCLRVIAVTLSLPAVVYILSSGASADGGLVSGGSLNRMSFSDFALAAAVASCGYALGRAARLPSAALLGPMILGLTLEIVGVIPELRLPGFIAVLAFGVIGWQAGLRFTVNTVKEIAAMLPTTTALVAVLIVVSCIIGWLLARLDGGTALDGYLAMSPGGIYAATETSANYSGDVAVVAVAQVTRIFLITLLTPLIAALLSRLSGRKRATLTSAPTMPPVGRRPQPLARPASPIWSSK